MGTLWRQIAKCAVFKKYQFTTAGYGKKQALTDVSFEVAKGDIVLLTGGNGSGKSTVLKTVYGLLKPRTPERKIIFEGNDVTALPVSAMIRHGIVYMPRKKNVFEDLTNQFSVFWTHRLMSQSRKTDGVGSNKSRKNQRFRNHIVALYFWVFGNESERYCRRIWFGTGDYG